MAGTKLWMVYIGGMVQGCHVELHDVRFCAGATIEDCYDDLRAQWWGTPETLHLDCWGAVEWADGYRVSLDSEEPGTGDKLWFVNLGGYAPGQFTELHENLLIVAADAAGAKRRALQQVAGWLSPHRDNLYAVEAVVDIAAADGAALSLIPDPAEIPFAFEAGYRSIGLPA